MTDERQAKAAWERYSCTVRMGGTEAERVWAFEEAMKHERKLMLADADAEARKREPAQVG